jgi:hypothetical protein
VALANGTFEEDVDENDDGDAARNAAAEIADDVGVDEGDEGGVGDPAYSIVAFGVRRQDEVWAVRGKADTACWRLFDAPVGFCDDIGSVLRFHGADGAEDETGESKECSTSHKYLH